jgi:hypothetical protein
MKACKWQPVYFWEQRAWWRIEGSWLHISISVQEDQEDGVLATYYGMRVCVELRSITYPVANSLLYSLPPSALPKFDAYVMMISPLGFRGELLYHQPKVLGKRQRATMASV